MAKVIKEIIIMLIICLISMLIFAIVLYNYIPNRKMVAQVSQYATSAEVETLLADDIDSKENEVVLTYEVSSKDLTSYEVANEYVPGKANPFESYAEDEYKENTSSNTQKENTSNETTSNDTQQNESKQNTDTVEENKSFIDDGGAK